MEDKKVCETCPNKDFCLVYSKYGEVHTPQGCIELTHQYKRDWRFEGNGV